MKNCALFGFSIVLSAIGGIANATSYTLPENSNDSVITQFHDDVPLTRVEQNETLPDVARRFLLGQTEIVRLNPDVDRWQVKKRRDCAFIQQTYFTGYAPRRDYPEYRRIPDVLLSADSKRGSAAGHVLRSRHRAARLENAFG